jgi:hypothetical protein
VFPDALLQEAGSPSFVALNCALMTWRTNRIIGRKDPLEYLKKLRFHQRIDHARDYGLAA